MKKKLFVVVLLVSVYILFNFAFTSLDNQGNVAKFFSEIGLSSSTAQASPAIASAQTASALEASFRLPIKPPKNPRKPDY